jgi:CRP-like cAMP-binding protein
VDSSYKAKIKERWNMCTASVTMYLLNDESFQNHLADAGLESLHTQVLYTLYSLDVSRQLGDYRAMLPVYLGMNWETCSRILEEIEQAGLIKRNENGIVLTHPINPDAMDTGCGHH